MMSAEFLLILIGFFLGLTTLGGTAWIWDKWDSRKTVERRARWLASRRCSDCIYYDASHTCRRYVGDFQVMAPNDWCGEYEGV